MRALLAAGASVAVHALVGAVLWAAPPERAVVWAEARPFEVEVVRVAPAVERPKELPEPAAKQPSRGPAPKRAAPVPTASPEPAIMALDSAPPPLDSARGTLDTVPDVPLPDPVPAPTLDTTELSRRLQAVAARCYPAAARRFRQTGEAEVRFCLDAAGALAESTVSRSSGSDLLDRAASGCVVQGAAPYGAEAHGHCFTVPVRFRQ